MTYPPGGAHPGAPQTGRHSTGAHPWPGPPPGQVGAPVAPTRVIGGRYVVLGELGRGGMGIVWRAEDRVIGRQVAVKELHLAEGLSPEDRHNFRERLLREARTAGRLSDPGIVTVYDVVTDNGVDHIVMELIDARTLADVVAQNGPLDERTATPVAQQLLSALRAAHEAGVAHRDVKPGNVMLTPSGRVKLTDFGIAHATDDTRLTSTGLLVGSPGYLSPEQLDGADASPASDLWALGATLFYAVEGRGPFTRDTTAATISAVLQAEIPPTRARGALGAVIAGLLQRDPTVRLTGPQAAAILGSPATSTMPVGGPHGPGPTTPLQQATRGGGWRRTLLWTAAALVVGLVAGGIGGRLLLPGLGEREITTLSYGAGGDVPEFDVSNGYCYQVAPGPGRAVDSGAMRDCDEVHDSQVFAAYLPYGSDDEVRYPGAEDFREFGAAACRMYFDNVVVGEDKDQLAVTLLLPSEEAFQDDTRSAGASRPSYQSRGVYCVLSAADGRQLTGTRVLDDS
ncbi:serine/threonine-protein kinase [Pseudonocardia humida]|uniref:non-specific serine/threonine protein kinase n=1 Tax=Pseudonocardia humida TaxID=2800819 RepID=A0ABT0ZW14_9PSEU|nr:serine/threonine-protein kinase [Pseudonocardia humida]MCO1654854.1 serine/threonine protein kinase [Pseudonocardia humida]